MIDAIFLRLRKLEYLKVLRALRVLECPDGIFNVNMSSIAGLRKLCSPNWPWFSKWLQLQPQARRFKDKQCPARHDSNLIILQSSKSVSVCLIDPNGEALAGTDPSRMWMLHSGFIKTRYKKQSARYSRSKCNKRDLCPTPRRNSTATSSTRISQTQN